MTLPIPHARRLRLVLRARGIGNHRPLSKQTDETARGAWREAFPPTRPRLWDREVWGAKARTSPTTDGNAICISAVRHCLTRLLQHADLRGPRARDRQGLAETLEVLAEACCGQRSTRRGQGGRRRHREGRGPVSGANGCVGPLRNSGQGGEGPSSLGASLSRASVASRLADRTSLANGKTSSDRQPRAPPRYRTQRHFPGLRERDSPRGAIHKG